MMRFTEYFQSPIGLIEIRGTEEAITSVRFVEKRQVGGSSSPLLVQAASQLEAYFEDERKRFDLPLAPSGTDFQQRVWRYLAEIPYGQMTSYQMVAQALGNPKAIRAVGAANGRNPIVIIIPCHRVVGSDGKLVGYGGGLWRKEWLLRHEGALLV